MSFYSIFYEYLPTIFDSVHDELFISKDVPKECRKMLKWLSANGYLVKTGVVELENGRKVHNQYKIPEKYLKYFLEQENE